MLFKGQVFAAAVLLCVVSPNPGAYAKGVADPVTAALNAVPTPPIAFVGIAPCRLADTRGNGVFPPGPFGRCAASPGQTGELTCSVCSR